MAELTGKRIIVTGTSSGIGAAAVRAFAVAGANIAALDVADDPGRQVVEEANKKGQGKARYYHCDVTSREGVQDVFKTAVAAMGGLDALVHIAGLERGAKAEAITDEDWDLMMNVNAKGTFITNQAAFPFLRDHGGRIVNFASRAGVVGLPDRAHYAASKGAVLGWTRTIAQEWAKYGITANAVAPGMWTPMYEASRVRLTPEQLVAHDAGMALRIPLGGKLGNPDRDMAPVLVFLVSDGARFITGQTLPVDGGFLMLT